MKTLAEAYEAWMAKLSARRPLPPEVVEALRRAFYVGASAYAQADPKTAARELVAYADADEKANHEEVPPVSRRHREEPSSHGGPPRPRPPRRLPRAREGQGMSGEDVLFYAVLCLSAFVVLWALAVLIGKDEEE